MGSSRLIYDSRSCVQWIVRRLYLYFERLRVGFTGLSWASVQSVVMRHLTRDTLCKEYMSVSHFIERDGIKNLPGQRLLFF